MISIANHDQTAYARLLRHAALNPARPAYCLLANGVEISASLTYQELQQNIVCVAAALQAQGLEGKVVLLVFEPGLDFVVAFWACLAAGVTAIPTLMPDGAVRKRALPRLHAIAADAGVQGVLHPRGAEQLLVELGLPHVQYLAVEADSAALADTHWAPVPAGSGTADAPAYLQYTSGSTAAPKGVEISQHALAGHLQALTTAWCYDETASALTWLPHSHDYGLVDGLLAPVFAGGTCHLMAPATFVRDPLRWLRAITRHRVTHTAAPPFALQLCRQALARHAVQSEKFDLRSLRVASTGAEPISAEVLEALLAILAEHGFASEAIWPAYGLAEAVLLVSTRDGLLARRFSRQRLAAGVAELSADGVALVSCGTAIPGSRLVIADPSDGRVLPENAVGEVWVASPARGHGYWRQPDLSDRQFAAVADDGERYLRTGDQGFLHQGELYLCGRIKDILILNGENIHANDLEAVAAQASAALSGAGNAAFSVLREGREELVLLQEIDLRRLPVDLPAVRAAIQAAVYAAFGFTLATLRFVRPRALPRTTSGKMQRAACREMWLAGGFAELEEAPAPLAVSAAVDAGAILALVRGWLASALGTAAVDPNLPFADLGLDSARVQSMVAALERDLGAAIDPVSVWQHPTPARFADFLARRTAAPARPPTHDLMAQLERELSRAY